MYAFLVSITLCGTVSFILIISADWANVKPIKEEVNDNYLIQIPHSFLEYNIRKVSVDSLYNEISEHEEYRKLSESETSRKVSEFKELDHIYIAK